MKLVAKQLQFKIDGTTLIQDVSFTVPRHSFVGIIGPNGSGKSTLLKLLYSRYKPNAGEILLNERVLTKIKEKERAREMSVLAQENELSFDFTVEQVVEMGRYPHKGFFEEYTKDDKAIVKQSMEKVGVEQLKDRSFLSLSGGEKQRVLIARAFTQGTDFLVLDEPTNHLDIQYQMKLMDTVKNLDTTILAAIHDLNLAALYCDYLIVMKEGKIVQTGKTEDVLTIAMLKDVFGVNAHIAPNPVTNKLNVHYLPNDYV